MPLDVFQKPVVVRHVLYDVVADHQIEVVDRQVFGRDFIGSRQYTVERIARRSGCLG